MTEVPHDWEGIRILELGDRSLFSQTFPQNTLLLWTGTRAIKPQPQQRNFGLSSVWFLVRALRRGSFDVIVCYPPLYNPLGVRWIMRLVMRYGPLFPFALLRNCGFLFLRLATQTPVVVLDTEDTFTIGRHNFFLFARCRAFFKRELPTDFWKVFFKTAHHNLPSSRFRKRRFFRECVAKLRPLALGISSEKVERIASVMETHPPKSTDIFFAGEARNSSVRERGVAQLRALQAQDYVVDLAESPLSQAEYFARCARAHLVWSPEGYGWDCFRHYEAPLCGSVPLMSAPSIYRYQPLRANEHALYYDIEGDGLQRAVHAALRDKDRLSTMAQAAREHVLWLSHAPQIM